MICGTPNHQSINGTMHTGLGLFPILDSYEQNVVRNWELLRIKGGKYRGVLDRLEGKSIKGSRS